MVPDNRTDPPATDWDLYYASVPATAQVTRKYTASVLLRAMKRYAEPGNGRALSIVEVGGANSCFLDGILENVKPRSYDVIDTNVYGLSLLSQRVCSNSVVRTHQESILSLPSSLSGADVVFSVGLVEHFDPNGTKKAVESHFDLLRPGGLAIITFPTPTLLYRAARRGLQAAGLWKFPDERPLSPSEVTSTMQAHGEVLHEQTLWPLILTQYVVVARKHSANM